MYRKPHLVSHEYYQIYSSFKLVFLGADNFSENLRLLIFYVFAESLRLLSLHDYKYLRYFKGHHDRYVINHN